MGGPQGYYAKGNKSDGEKISYDFTYMWNLKSKIDKQTKQKQTHRYRAETGGCQRSGAKSRGKMKTLRSTNWQSQSREDESWAFWRTST